MWDSLRVAAVQYDITGGLDPVQFYDKLEKKVSEAARAGAQLILFPELFSADLFENGTTAESEVASIRRIVNEITPRFMVRISELAVKHQLAIQAGTIPRLLGNGQIVNSALLALADGRNAIQDKVFITHCESVHWKWSGSQELKIIDAPWGPTVISICLDTELPVLSSLLARYRPELILVPSCTGSIFGFNRVRYTAQSRAVEHYAYVVHTGTVGPGTTTPNMNTQYGQAAFISPCDGPFEGGQIEGVINQAQIVHATLDLVKLRKARQATLVYPARDQCDRALPVSITPLVPGKGPLS